MLDHKAVMLPLKVYMHTNEIDMCQFHTHLSPLEIANWIWMSLQTSVLCGTITPCKKQKQTHKCNFKVKFGKFQGHTMSSVETQSGVIS